MVKIKTCPVCGKPFFPIPVNKIYCCVSCRNKVFAYQKKGKIKKNLKLDSQNKTIKPPKKCIICGDLFKPYSSNQKYCSYECKREAQKIQARERYRKNHPINFSRICPICGKEFPYNKKQKYCSYECKKEAQKRQFHEYYLKNKEKIKEKRKIWSSKNPDYYKNYLKK